MIDIRKSEPFGQWLDGLSDLRARARIQARIDRLQDGNAGDVAPVGEGVSELRLHFGSGWRVYFTEHKGQVIILLVGGRKGTQAKDIKLAMKLARNL